jgi:hypothetical protein
VVIVSPAPSVGLAPRLQFGFPGRSRHCRELRLARAGRVVQHEFTVERQHAAIFQQRQRIDLDEVGIVIAKTPVKPDQDVSDRLSGYAEVAICEQGRGVTRVKSPGKIDDMPPDRPRVTFRDFLDVHTALHGEEHHGPARNDVDQHRRVKFTHDLATLLDQQPLDAMAADLHAQDRARRVGSSRGRIREPDAPRLAALARRHLRLDDCRTQGCNRLDGFLSRCAHPRLRNWYARRLQQGGLRRIFLEIHAALFIVRSGPNVARRVLPPTACLRRSARPDG